MKKQIKTMVDSIGTIVWTSFVSAVYRSKETKELARYVLNMGISHRKVLFRDIEKLWALWEDTLFYTSLVLRYSEAIVNKAFCELEKSLLTSLESTNERAQAQIDAYVKINKGVKSRPLTLCKNEIKKHFKSTKYRTLRFDGTNVFTSEGNTIEFSNE